MSDTKEIITYFAQTNYRNQKVKFGIKLDDRRRHVYMLGKTGMGKTTMLEQFVLSDIKNGNGICFVDPHGDSAEKVLDYVPAHRIKDVVYFNPSDLNFPFGFNVLEAVEESHRHLVASGLMGVFKKIWPDVWSARMEYIMNNCILALVSYPKSTLLGINRLLVDPDFRKQVLTFVTDPVVKSFWVEEYNKWDQKFRTEAIAPIQNKVGQFLSASLIRNILAQTESTFNIREIMDSGKILILNLSKGRIGEDNSRLLGGMLITKIQLAAMERVDTLENERRDFYLYVDEFQNFSTESFANILSEARKYRLSLIMAHQYIEQLDETVAAAVFGNVGTMMTFRVGGKDAEFLEKEFAPTFTKQDIVNLPKYNIYLKLMIDGVASAPFSATTLPPDWEKDGLREKVIEYSRATYGRARNVVEDKIMRWTGLVGDDDDGAPSGVPALSKSAPPTPTGGGEYTCDVCGSVAFLSFDPDPSKAIYCKKCLKKLREGKIPSVRKPGSSAPPSSAKPAPKPAPSAPKQKTSTKELPEEARQSAKITITKDGAPVSLEDVFGKKQES